MLLKVKMYFFFITFFFVEFVKSAIVFSAPSLSQPTSGETSVTITGMTNALTTTNFAFRTIGKTIWHNGVFSPPEYFAISNFRKVTATSNTAGTALLAPFTLGKDEYQELVVVTAVPKNFALSVTGVAYTLNNHPVAATKTLLNTVNFKNLASFIFGSSSKGFSKARKTNAGVRNYGGIIATRIIGLNNTAPEDPVQCRLRLNALGILSSVMLGSDVILSDSSRIDGTYKVFQTEDRYTFQRSEYQLLSIFGSIEMDVLSTDLYDCQFANGTGVEPPELDIYSISSKLGNATTTATAPKAITCPLGCTQCDKANNCLQTSDCLFDPESGRCMTDLICPLTRPFEMTNRTDMRQQCFKELGNQIILEKLIVSTTNITIGIFINPQLYISTAINQYCMIYAEVGVFAPSSKFFFPMNYPGSFMPQLASLNSRIIYKFMNYVYNPTFPFAPKKIMAVEVSPPVSEFRMVVRNINPLRNNPLGWRAFLESPELLYDAQEFYAINEFSVEKGNHYLIELYITYQATDRLAIRMPASQALLYTNGNLSVLNVTDNILGINPNQCSVRAACFLHIGFAADSDGIFEIDQSLVSGFTTPLLREVKQIVFDSDPYCPPDSFIGSNPYSCECQSGYYANTTLVKCLDCNDMCLTCNGGTEKNCTSCADPFILVNGECLCGSGMQREGSTCVPIECHATCLTCNGETEKSCTSCSDPFILVDGECVCEDGMQRKGSTCEPICHEMCLTCDGGTEKDCTSCSDPFVLINGECVCESGMQKEGSTCVPIECHATCLTCNGETEKSCTSCSDPFILVDEECVCETGMQREASTCVPICHEMCLTCNGGTENDCTSCSDPFILVNGECLCGSGMQREGSTCVPIECHEACLTCNGETENDCASCQSPFILVNGECVCESGMQRQGSTCVPIDPECHETCLTCDGGTETDCTSCSNPFILINGECLCESGMQREGSICVPIDPECHEMCLTCNGGTEKNCTSCSDPFILINGECLCESGMQRQGSTCVPIDPECHETCLTCDGGTKNDCTSCSNPFTLINGECVCGAGMQRQGSTCVPTDPGCHEMCLTCNGATEKDCTSCSNPFILVNGECICGAGMQRQGSTCVPIDPECHETCLTCDGGTKNDCTSCSNPFTLINGECICGAGMQRQGPTCVPTDPECHETCLTCNGGTDNDCTSCADPFILVNGECVCENGMQRQGSICVPIDPECHETCLTCDGGTKNDCTSCSNPFTLINGECICGAGMQRQGSICVPVTPECHKTCLTCNGGTEKNCTSCSDPFILMHGECLCKNGMQREGAICKPTDNQTNPNNPKPNTPTVVISQSFQQPWIKIIYLFFYGISIIIVILSFKRYLKDKRKEGKQNILAKEISEEKPDSIDKLLKTFLDYSPLAALIRNKLCCSKKFHCVFHFLLFLNIKLFAGALVTSAFIKGNPFIAPEDVSKKFFLIIGAEIAVSVFLEIFYSIILRLFARFRTSIIILAGISSAIMVLVTERKVLDKLNNISGFILICFFIVSIIIHYIWIDGLLALITQYSTVVQKLRKLNIYKIQPNNRAKALKIASMPASNPSLAVFDLDETTKRERSQVPSFKRFEINNMTSSSVLNQ